MVRSAPAPLQLRRGLVSELLLLCLSSISLIIFVLQSSWACDEWPVIFHPSPQPSCATKPQRSLLRCRKEFRVARRWTILITYWSLDFQLTVSNYFLRGICATRHALHAPKEKWGLLIQMVGQYELYFNWLFYLDHPFKYVWCSLFVINSISLFSSYIYCHSK